MMNEFENIRIEQLPGSNYEQGLNQNQLKEYFDDKFFDNLEKGDIKIKKQGDMFIFISEENNENALDASTNHEFMVKEKVFQEFLEDNLAKDEITLESDALLKKFFSTIQSKKELSGLEEEVTSQNKESNEQNKESLQLADNPDALIEKIDNLLVRFKANKAWPKGPRIINDKTSKKRFKQVIKNDIAILTNMEKDLKRVQKKPELFYENLDYYVVELEKLEDHKNKLQEVRQGIVLGKNTAEIPALLNSLKDIKQESYFQNKAAKYNVEFNKIMKDLTLKKLRNKDAEGFQEYLEGVWSGDIEHAQQSPFYMRYKKDFEYIASVNPQLYVEITTTKQRTNNPNPKYCSNEYNMAQIARNNRYVKKGNAFDNIGNILGGELFYDKLLGGNDPKKREARAQASKLGAIIGGVVLGFQFFKNLFAKSGTKGKRTNVALYGGGLLALLNFNKLADWTKTVSGKTGDVEKTFGVDQSPIYQEYVSPAITSMEAIGGIPIKTLVGERIVVEKYGKLNLDYDKYVELVNNDINLSNKEKTNAIKAADKIKADGNLLHNGLGLLGISSIKDLETLYGQDENKTLLDTDRMSNHFENLVSPVNSILAIEGFKPKDAKSWHTISQEYDPNDFGNLIILDRINRGLIILKDSEKHNLDEMADNSDLDLVNKTLKGLKNETGHEIKFKTYEELFNTVKLTNFIKSNFKGRTGLSEEPFHVALLGNIEFDDTRWHQVWKNETDVIKANWKTNSLKKVSPILEQHKASYVKYLNDWRKREGKNS